MNRLVQHGILMGKKQATAYLLSDGDRRIRNIRYIRRLHKVLEENLGRKKKKAHVGIEIAF